MIPSKVGLDAIVKEFSLEQFDELTSFFLEHCGGSLAQRYLLLNRDRVRSYRLLDIEVLVRNMTHNRALGGDALLRFYAMFSRVPLSNFCSLKKFDVDVRGSYSAPVFERRDSTVFLRSRERVLKFLDLNEEDLKANYAQSSINGENEQ